VLWKKNLRGGKNDTAVVIGARRATVRHRAPEDFYAAGRFRNRCKALRHHAFRNVEKFTARIGRVADAIVDACCVVVCFARAEIGNGRRIYCLLSGVGVFFVALV
jgi:hypothetical protein